MQPRVSKLAVPKLVWSALAATMALAGCADNMPPLPTTGDRYVLNAPGGEAYALGAGDKLRVTVFNEPQLSGEFQVGIDGSLSLPLIGTMQVLGKTPGEVSAMVMTAETARGMLRNPRVSSEVTTYRPFYIVGEVRSPGQYAYSAGLTVLNAVATAQGYTPRARKTQVFIRKYGEAEEHPYTITPDLRVWPGDTVRVVERFF